MSTPLADVLGTYLQQTHTSVNRLAKLSGIPQRTIANWLNGYIHKPHQWQPLIKVARALHLNESETNTLLQAAGYPSIAELRDHITTTDDRELLAGLQQSSSARTVPFQAIIDLPTFVGRTKQIEELKRALLSNGNICGLRGMGGVGKTSLAAHLAYQLRNEFPDGVLWARLDTSDPLSILGAFADAYGKDVSQYKDIESRGSVVRNLLVQKRALIILDNVEASSQVRAILPPNVGTCKVLITTRHDLTILDGAECVTLEPFIGASNESLQLFERYLDAQFIRAHQTQLSEVANLLGHLPLALSIVAGRIAWERSRVSPSPDQETLILKSLLDSLHASSERLDTLTREDMGVRASFDISYAALSPSRQGLFCSLGVFSEEDFGIDAVSYLNDISREQANAALRHLQSLSLVQESRDGRWRLHPLLHDYAREKMERAGRLALVVEKMLLMYRQAAQEQWSFERSLDEEISNSRFALEQAGQLKLERPLIETVRAMFPTFSVGGWFTLARPALEQACLAAKALEDQDAMLFFVNGLAIVQLGLGDVTSSRENLQLALQLAQSLGRKHEAVDIYMSLGKLELDRGYFRQAKILFEESLSLAREIGSQNQVGMVINNLALILVREARYAEAGAMFQESLEIVRAHNNVPAMIIAYTNLGDVCSLQNQWDRAYDYWQEGLTLARASRDRSNTAVMLANLGLAQAERQEGDQWREYFEEAIDVAHEINSPRIESAARSEFGSVLRKQRQFDESLEQLNRSIELADASGDMERKGLSLLYLGSLLLDRNQLQNADTVLADALQLSKEIEQDLLRADITFVRAKVFYARAQHSTAREMAKEALQIYEQAQLLRQRQDVQNWLQSME